MILLPTSSLEHNAFDLVPLEGLSNTPTGQISAKDVTKEIYSTSVDRKMDINSIDPRRLAGSNFTTPGTKISYNDLRGKGWTYDIIVNGHHGPIDLASHSISQTIVRVIIKHNAVLYAGTSPYALYARNLPAHVKEFHLIIESTGRISGYGGTGGGGGHGGSEGKPGSTAGDAIVVSLPPRIKIYINNKADRSPYGILGGGGGGGGGGGCTEKHGWRCHKRRKGYGGGGGGGAGWNPGTGGGPNSHRGGNGSTTGPGGGGNGWKSNGGAGGTFGANGVKGVHTGGNCNGPCGKERPGGGRGGRGGYAMTGSHGAYIWIRRGYIKGIVR